MIYGILSSIGPAVTESVLYFNADDIAEDIAEDTDVKTGALQMKKNQ